MNYERYSRDNLPEVLRAHRINPTHQRIEIAYTLFDRREHLSADQLLALVNRQDPVSSRATLYNTLRLFVQQGMIREVIVDPARVFYDPNTSEHYHLYDVGTGTLMDIDAADVRIRGLPQLPPGVVVVGMDLIVRIRSS